jgi:hypothetical protein
LGRVYFPVLRLGKYILVGVWARVYFVEMRASIPSVEVTLQVYFPVLGVGQEVYFPVLRLGKVYFPVLRVGQVYFPL